MPFDGVFRECANYKAHSVLWVRVSASTARTASREILWKTIYYMLNWSTGNLVSKTTIGRCRKLHGVIFWFTTSLWLHFFLKLCLLMSTEVNFVYSVIIWSLPAELACKSNCTLKFISQSCKSRIKCSIQPFHIERQQCHFLFLHNHCLSVARNRKRKESL